MQGSGDGKDGFSEDLRAFSSKRCEQQVMGMET